MKVKCDFTSCYFNKNDYCQNEEIHLAAVVIGEEFCEQCAANDGENFQEGEDKELLFCRDYRCKRCEHIEQPCERCDF